MTTNTIFENELAKIWIDEFAPLIFIKLKKVPEAEKQANRLRKLNLWLSSSNLKNTMLPTQ
jgi:hypothetical protein